MLENCSVCKTKKCNCKDSNMSGEMCNCKVSNQISIKCNCKDCDCNVIHNNLVDEAKSKMISFAEINKMCEIFKAMADTTRLGIVSLLYDNELCVCDISSILNLTKSTISHQLKYLREVDLVKNRKIGKEVWYSLSDKHIFSIYNICREHILEEKND